MGNDCNCYKGGDTGNFDLKDKVDDLMHPGETKTEKFIRKVGEGMEDAKDKIVDAYEDVKDKITG